MNLTLAVFFVTIVHRASQSKPRACIAHPIHGVHTQAQPSFEASFVSLVISDFALESAVSPWLRLMLTSTPSGLMMGWRPYRDSVC